ncbi:MAG: sigma-54-dependent Fis family transcriptional regulator [Planctomycetota bacterium]|nr:MAG: sigma-54-dependent Fis family transcriptional regulator [Planctomycetota bacterium]
MPSDVIDLLLPRAPSALSARARSAVQFLSLLRDHARPVHASTTAVSLERAQEFSLSEERDAAIRALEGLIAHCVRAELGTDTFLCLPEPELSWTDGWKRLGELYDVVEPAVDVPAPGESAPCLVRRLAAALAELDASAARRLVFDACATRFERGIASAEAALSSALQSSSLQSNPGQGAAVGELAWLVHGIAALRLDRGAVRQARALLDDYMALVAVEPRLAQLAAWCAWLLDDAAAATELARGLPPANPLPDGLAEWQAHGGPAFGAAAAPSSDAVAVPAAVARPSGRAISRSDYGACALLLVRFEAGEPALHASDCSPGHRGALDAWLCDRASSHRTSGEPEQRLIAGRCAVVEHRAGAEPMRGCLGGAGVLAIALEPVLRGGELLGWVRLEFEHHLVPSRARLLRLAADCASELEPRGPGVGARSETRPASAPEAGRATRRRSLARIASARGRSAPDERGSSNSPGSVSGSAPEIASSARAASSGAEPSASDSAAALVDALPETGASDPRARCLFELVERLEMKLAQRRWWGFDVLRGRPRLLCEHGGELGDWRAQPGRAQALTRALQCQGVAWFDDPDPSQALHAASNSGVVVSICWHGRVIGLVAIESQRRRDLRALDPALLESWRALAAERLRAACFRAWHLRHFGHDVHVDLAAPALRATLTEICAAARARRPVALHGPTGSGKRVFARLLHYEAARGAPLLRMHGVVACAEHASNRLFGARRREGLWSRARGGTLVIEHVDSLPPLVQRRLHEALEKASIDAFAGAPRLVATSGASIGESVATGALLPCLADHFDGLEIAVPSLAQRRDEIPVLARHFLERLAAEERLDTPALGESCLALLWRQDWPGNLRELEQFLYRLALLCPGREIDAAELARAAARHRLDLSKRIAPRQAERELVAMALSCTRKQNGSFNKSRAASYLGWETETLVARLREFEAQGTPIAEPIV